MKQGLSEPFSDDLFAAALFSPSCQLACIDTAYLSALISAPRRRRREGRLTAGVVQKQSESVKNKKGASCALFLFVFNTSSETRRRTSLQSSSPSCKPLSCKVSCKADSWAVSTKSRCRRLVVLTPNARSFSARLTRLPRPCESCL